VWITSPLQHRQAGQERRVDEVGAGVMEPTGWRVCLGARSSAAHACLAAVPTQLPQGPEGTAPHPRSTRY
jgi:hypothetical protein